jgi:hypothetical protein
MASLVMTERSKMKRLLEVRIYRLKPGMMPVFQHLVRTQSVPMLRAKGMDVVAYGQSNHEEETYFLARSYANREALEKEQSDFYGSNDWKLGPRSEIVACIETYMNTLLWVSDAGIASMRELNQQA